MSKPDDVSQEDWDAAKSVFRDYEGPDTLDIARLIMAARLQEREECAEVAEDWGKNVNDPFAEVDSEEIAQDIRNRK